MWLTCHDEPFYSFSPHLVAIASSHSSLSENRFPTSSPRSAQTIKAPIYVIDSNSEADDDVPEEEDSDEEKYIPRSHAKAKAATTPAKPKSPAPARSSSSKPGTATKPAKGMRLPEGFVSAAHWADACNAVM